MKQKRCKVYYHFTGKTTAHRLVIWPDKTVTVSRVRINPKTGDEKHIETLKPRRTVAK